LFSSSSPLVQLAEPVRSAYIILPVMEEVPWRDHSPTALSLLVSRQQSMMSTGVALWRSEGWMGQEYGWPLGYMRTRSTNVLQGKRSLAVVDDIWALSLPWTSGKCHLLNILNHRPSSPGSSLLLLTGSRLEFALKSKESLTQPVKLTIKGSFSPEAQRLQISANTGAFQHTHTHTHTTPHHTTYIYHIHVDYTHKLHTHIHTSHTHTRHTYTHTIHTTHIQHIQTVHTTHTHNTHTPHTYIDTHTLHTHTPQTHMHIIHITHNIHTTHNTHNTHTILISTPHIYRHTSHTQIFTYHTHLSYTHTPPTHIQDTHTIHVTHIQHTSHTYTTQRLYTQHTHTHYTYTPHIYRHTLHIPQKHICTAYTSHTTHNTTHTTHIQYTHTTHLHPTHI
jgi:hypothetical protein